MVIYLLVHYLMRGFTPKDGHESKNGGLPRLHFEVLDDGVCRMMSNHPTAVRPSAFSAYIVAWRNDGPKPQHWANMVTDTQCILCSLVTAAHFLSTAGLPNPIAKHAGLGRSRLVVPRTMTASTHFAGSCYSIKKSKGYFSVVIWLPYDPYRLRSLDQSNPASFFKFPSPGPSPYWVWPLARGQEPKTPIHKPRDWKAPYWPRNPV